MLFGDSSLKVYTTTPAAGEAVAAIFTADWFGHRVNPVTATLKNESSLWQFQIAAPPDWETSQTYMMGVVAITVDDRRWAIVKAEKPVGASLVWKFKAELQQ